MGFGLVPIAHTRKTRLGLSQGLENGMTLNQAHAAAKRRSKAKSCDFYVVHDSDAEGWDATDDYGLDTYYLGARIEAHYFCGELVLGD